MVSTGAKVDNCLHTGEVGTHRNRVLRPVVSDSRRMMDGEVRSTNCKYVLVTLSSWLVGRLALCVLMFTGRTQRGHAVNNVDRKRRYLILRNPKRFRFERA